MGIDSEFMDEMRKLVEGKLSSEERISLANAYDKLAGRYEILAKEAREHAASHRELAAQGK